MFKDEPAVVPIIAPLNEQVTLHIYLNPEFTYVPYRPAGYDGQAILTAVRQVCITTLFFSPLTFFVFSTGLTVTAMFGASLLLCLSQFDLNFFLRYPYGSSEQSNTVVLLHDAFQPLSYWNGFMNYNNGQYQGVAMDTHIYQMFSDAVSLHCFLIVYDVRH